MTVAALTTERAAQKRPGARERLGALRIPPHIGVMLGVSTAAYAVTLAGVTGLQAASETSQIADRAPVVAGLQDLHARNGQLARDLAASANEYQMEATAYQGVGPRLADLETALAGLATSVKSIDGVSRSLPSHVSLPTISRVSGPAAAAPATSATTGASGVVVP